MNWRIGIAVLGVMAAGAFGAEGAATRPGVRVTVSKETTGAVGPLLADGRVDYVGAMNDRYGKGVLPGENGFTAYVEGGGVLAWGWAKNMAGLCGARRWSEGGFYGYLGYVYGQTGKVDANRVDAELKDAGAKPWVKGEGHDPLLEYLQLQEKEVQVYEAALEKPVWWVPCVDRHGRLQGDTLWWSTLEEVATFECARAMHRAGTGDVAGATRDIRVAFRAAGVARLEGGLWDGHVAGQMQVRACAAVGGLVGTGNLTRGQREAVGKMVTLAGHLAGPGEAVDVYERWRGLGSVVATAENGEGDGSPTLIMEDWSEVTSEAVDWDVVLKRVNAAADAVVAAITLPTKEEERAALEKWASKREFERRNVPLQAGEGRGAYTERVAVGMAAAHVAQQENLLRGWRAVGAAEDLVGVVMSLAAYREDHGEWPGKLAELVPRYLREVPRDPFTREGRVEVGYGVSERGVYVYSVGEDGKDDAGEGDDVCVGVR